MHSLTPVLRRRSCPIRNAMNERWGRGGGAPSIQHAPSLSSSHRPSSCQRNVGNANHARNSNLRLERQTAQLSAHHARSMDIHACHDHNPSCLQHLVLAASLLLQHPHRFDASTYLFGARGDKYIVHVLVKASVAIISAESIGRIA